EFINRDLVEFWKLDLRRSIPCLVDGLKPSQRKVLFTLFKRFDGGKEIRVSQLAGAVAQNSLYHHGEDSLVRTIIRLAQNFVGSNNLNLLLPVGQFGTRLAGGKDAASARYIYTTLSPLCRMLFPVKDDSVLKYLTEEEQSIEPEWYCPVIPLVLINGAEGIGTGWSTKLLPRNPSEVIENVARMIDNASVLKMLPFFRGFKGTVVENSFNRYTISGTASVLPTQRRKGMMKVVINELPIGCWTQDYKENVLDSLERKSLIIGYKEEHTENCVRFIVEMEKQKVTQQQLSQMFKLRRSFGKASVVLFDEHGKLQVYSSPEEILQSFFHVRRQKYIERREKEILSCKMKLRILSNQRRFIEEKNAGDIILENRNHGEIIQQLIEKGYDPFPAVCNENSSNSNFKYILDMPMSRLSNEELEVLLRKETVQREELQEVEESTWRDLWKKDLSSLSVAIEGNGTCRR
ncbi:hypothetical protein AB6A40_009651, partial [Gnathostoma spinigerum]